MFELIWKNKRLYDTEATLHYTLNLEDTNVMDVIDASAN